MTWGLKSVHLFVFPIRYMLTSSRSRHHDDITLLR